MIVIVELILQKNYFFLRAEILMFIITIAIMIKEMPSHCNKTTFSLRIIKAIITETGSSSAETILPNPMPVIGKPKLSNIGGMIVPKSARKIPHFKKILKLKGVVCVKRANAKTMIAPPKSIYKLRCADEIPTATLLAVSMVVVKDAAANIPQKIPRQSNSIFLFKILVAIMVPISTTITAIIFCIEGTFFSRIISNKTPIQTVCINKTIAIETLIYRTHK